MPKSLSKVEKLQKWKKMYDPESVGIIFRYPPGPLGLLLKSSCPLSFSAKDKMTKIPKSLNMTNMSLDQKLIIQTIHSTKNLRKLGGGKLCKNFNNCSL